jgi:hypothetical protein
VYAVYITLWITGIIATVSIMPAWHRERYYGSVRKTSTITPEFCPRSNGIAVHDALESLYFISRNNQCPLRNQFPTVLTVLHHAMPSPVKLSG